MAGRSCRELPNIKQKGMRSLAYQNSVHGAPTCAPKKYGDFILEADVKIEPGVRRQLNLNFFG